MTKKNSGKNSDEKPKTIGFSLMSFLESGGDDLDPSAGLNDRLLSVAEAAKLRGTSKVAIHSLIQRGRLKAIEIGGRKFIKLSELDSFEIQKPGPKSGETEDLPKGK